VSRDRHLDIRLRQESDAAVARAVANHRPEIRIRRAVMTSWAITALIRPSSVSTPFIR